MLISYNQFGDYMQIVYKKNTLYVLTDYLDRKKVTKLKKIMDVYNISNIIIRENDILRQAELSFYPAKIPAKNCTL